MLNDLMVSSGILKRGDSVFKSTLNPATSVLWQIIDLKLGFCLKPVGISPSHAGCKNQHPCNDLFVKLGVLPLFSLI